MSSFTELGEMFGLEGRFLRGNSICFGQVKFELLLLCWTPVWDWQVDSGSLNLELSGEAWLATPRERRAGPNCTPIL